MIDNNEAISFSVNELKLLIYEELLSLLYESSDYKYHESHKLKLNVDKALNTLVIKIIKLKEQTNE